MDEDIRRLQDIIDESSRIVFSEVRGYLQRVTFLILEVRMDFTGRSTDSRPNRL